MKKRLYLIVISIFSLSVDVNAAEDTQRKDMGADICISLIAVYDRYLDFYDNPEGFIRTELVPHMLNVHCIRERLEGNIQGARVRLVKQSGQYHILSGQKNGSMSKHDPIALGVDLKDLDNLCKAVDAHPEGFVLRSDWLWEKINVFQRDSTKVYVSVINKTLRQRSGGYNVYDFKGKFQNNPDWRDSITNMELKDLEEDNALVCIYEGQIKSMVSIPEMDKKETVYFSREHLRDLKFQLGQQDIDLERLHGDYKYPLEISNARNVFSFSRHFTISIYDDSDYWIDDEGVFKYQPPSKICLEVTNGRDDLTVLHEWAEKVWVPIIIQKYLTAIEDLLLFSIVLFNDYPPLQIEINKEFNVTYQEFRDLGFQIFFG
jgi:hypothetical protein